MTKPKYKILIVRDEQEFCDYADWLSGNSHADYQIQESQFSDYLIASQVNGSVELSQLTWADCMIWDSKIDNEFLEHLQHLSVPVVILVSEPEELAGLNFLLKATITKELLSSTICHGIAQAELRKRLEQAEAILKEQELLKHKLQLEQSVNLLLQSIHSSFDLSTIFTAATTAIGKLLKLDRVEITQYLPEQEIWTPIIEYLDRLDIPSALGKVVPDQNNEISRKLKQGEIVIINSYTDVECTINRDLLEEYPGSWLIMPIVVGSKVWGVISLDCHHRHRHWLDMEVDLAINISTQLAIAIQQSNFYHQLEQELSDRQVAEAKSQQAESNLILLNQELESRIEKRTTDLRRSKEILQISEQRFRSFFTLAPIGIAVVEAQTYQLVAVNQAYCQFLNYTEAELLKIESCASLSEPADWELEMPLADSLIRGGINSYQLEQRYIRKNGTIVIGDITATKICDRVGNVTHIIKMVQNITQQKLDRVALKRSEELLRLTIENTPIGILTLGLDGKFLTVNHDTCRIFGYSAEELLQMTALDLTHPNFKEETLYIFNQIAKGELINGQIEKQYIDKSGKIIDAISRVGMVRDEDGNPLHFVVGVEDITEKKQIEKALNQQYERQRFISKITQQIRQSLNLNKVLNAAVNEVNGLLNCDRIIIFQLFKNGNSKVVKEIVKPEYPSIFEMNWQDEHFSDEGFEYYINSKFRIVNDIPQDDFASCIAEFMTFAQVKSKIVAPIIQNIQSATPNLDNRWQQDNAQLWGLLIVHSCGEQRQWQTEEADLLQQVANQLAIAIQQADLYAQIANELSTRKHLELELSRQAAADRLLSEITIAINESSKLDQVLDISLQKVQQLLESDRVLIFQIGADGQGKVVKESVTDPKLSILDRIISDSCFATTDLGEQYLQGKVTILQDIETADNIAPCYADLMHEHQIRANLAAPIIHSNQLWGLLLVHQCHIPRVWLPYEINLIKQVATQIGISAHKEKLILRLTSELHQKEILLKEIHHRVKNNLQVMSSLLRMQFRKSTPEVKSLCEEYQNQIQSMALIHDQLHQSKDLANIDFYRYIVNLTDNLFHCYGINSELVQLNLSVDNIFLPLDQSIPLGLIINELISNALKYAFPHMCGQINIALSQREQFLQLVVADNGVGISEDFDLETTNSMGLQLIYSLTDQLEGKVIYDSLGDTPHKGTRFEITFPMG